jgi:hypothetical protein
MSKNVDIRRLTDFEEKVLLLEAAGGDISTVMLVLPTVIRPDEPFALGISLLDKDMLPVCVGTKSFEVRLDDQSFEIPAFEKDKPAVCKLPGLRLQRKALIRASARYNGDEFFSNPAVISNEKRPRIFWGDPHVHTTVGDCHAERCRTRNLAYVAARFVYHLDFVAIADHVSNSPRGTKGMWLDNIASCDLYDEPDYFSALYCYEASLKGGHGGDNNVYLKDRQDSYVDPWEDELHIGELCERLDGEIFVVPHHTTRTGKHGELPSSIYPGKAKMPVVEIHSKWGTSEYRGNPNALHTTHDGPSYVQDLLAQGYRLGFVAGTDSHTSLTFCRSLESPIHDRMPGLTAVYTQRNERGVIYDAIKSARCYAASGERILLDVDSKSIDRLSLSVTAAAQSDIESVEIVRNGDVIHTTRPDGWNATCEWEGTPLAPTEYCYVRVSATSGAQAWSSPIYANREEKE